MVVSSALELYNVETKKKLYSRQVLVLGIQLKVAV